MANHGIFIGWGGTVTGRERKAEIVFGEGIAYFTQLQQEARRSHTGFLAVGLGASTGYDARSRLLCPGSADSTSREDWSPVNHPTR